MAKKASKKTGKKTSKATPRRAASAASHKKISKKGAKRKPPATPKADPGAKALEGLRKQIDQLDRRLIRLLNDRASLAKSIGKVKRSQPDGDRKIYASDREALVLDRILKANEGPLPARSIEAIYREIMSGMIALEQPVRIGFLGPAGSHSHDAAIRHFGRSVELVFEDVHTISGVFDEVARGNIDYGLVPIENSTGGGVVDTLDAFLEFGQDVTIYAEVQIEIHHCLLAQCGPKDIKRIYSKPDVFAQCKKWLGDQMSGRELIDAPSSSRAVQIAVEENKKLASLGYPMTTAAIGNRLAGEAYGLDELFESIEDKANNITRFFVIGKEQAGQTGDDKTSIMFTTDDRAGALVEVLGVFHAAGVNLSHIDKRPSGRENWTYTFFCDALGHRDESVMSAALARAGAHCKELRVLGSYPRSKRIL